MPNINAKNARIKHDYLTYLKESDGKAESTIDAVCKAISRYEEYAGNADFSAFTKEKAIVFKRRLTESKAQRTGKPISPATVSATLNMVKSFFKWLAFQPAYKNHIHVPDISFLNLSDKETRAAQAPKMKIYPAPDMIVKAIEAMPHTTAIQRRDRALMAFIFLTGMRDAAVVSLKLKHINLSTNTVTQDPAEVNTKFSKRMYTAFFPVPDIIKTIVIDWIHELTAVYRYTPDDPVFPKTATGQDDASCFHAAGLTPDHWQTTEPVRKAFRAGFTAAGLPYYKPHSFRDTLVNMGESICRTPGEFKAWSMNLGHEHISTTLTSYATMDVNTQLDMMKTISAPPPEGEPRYTLAEAGAMFAKMAQNR